jgi:hypothetical protein
MSSPITPREVIAQIQWRSVPEFCNNYLDYLGISDEAEQILEVPVLNELVTLSVEYFDAKEDHADTSAIEATVKRTIAMIESGA